MACCCGAAELAYAEEFDGDAMGEARGQELEEAFNYGGLCVSHDSEKFGVRNSGYGEGEV